MIEIKGLTGLRPAKESINQITCPPYDVIKTGTELETNLKNNPDSLYHITLGKHPAEALKRLQELGLLQKDDLSCFYIYEQTYGNVIRTGVLTATEVSDYAQGKIIRHEKTFDDKVKGRIELRSRTGYTFEPVFLLTQAKLEEIFAEIKREYSPEYEFVSAFGGSSELHGIKNRVFRVLEESQAGLSLKREIGKRPLYIADGHHRYHASLLNGQTHCLAYICEAKQARIQAYNRVIKAPVAFEDVKDQLALTPVKEFATPGRHYFSIYTKEGCYSLKASHVPEDVIGRLDCSILEKELYPLLGLSHDMIMDARYFDYYAEYQLDKMVEAVNSGQYDLAVALHPVSSEELMAVADAGIRDRSIVMPEKSTFFAPKILSGIFIYKHALK